MESRDLEGKWDRYSKGEGRPVVIVTEERQECQPKFFRKLLITTTGSDRHRDERLLFRGTRNSPSSAMISIL